MTLRHKFCDLHQKILETHCDEPVAVIVVFFKRVRDTLDVDAALNKHIERHFSDASVFADARTSRKYKLNACRHKLIPKRGEGSAEFVYRDGLARVSIKTVEKISPLVQILPKLTKFLEVERAIVVTIEHFDHDAHGVWVEP